uniref:Orc1-like AAA ATPase domain-containing protein n=1 Tax=Odontella aurita TaxID=265563 RepID=A0A7S4MJX0_9STRA|mmetsp:Transcript_23667/g.70009  ORF Transcript_23667/g.70009 Transcript_23667/m.70009 type:complete len:1556 (+) Transcript_23667:54-4721(+)
MALEVTNGGIPSSLGKGDNRRLLFRPEDREALSKLSCLVRCHVEAFTATAEDVTSRFVRGGKNSHIVVGSVGIRCAHCAPPPDGIDRRDATAAEWKSSGRGAVSYPRYVRLVYQAVRNWQRYHLLTCPSIPDEIKSEYLELKSGRLQGKRGVIRAEYWEQCCRRIGMIDTDEGIRLRNGRFADDNDVIGDFNGVSPVSNKTSCSKQSTSYHIITERKRSEKSYSNAHGVINGTKPQSPLPIPEVHFEAIANGLECDASIQKNERRMTHLNKAESQDSIDIGEYQKPHIQTSALPSAGPLPTLESSRGTSIEPEEEKNELISRVNKGVTIPSEAAHLDENSTTWDTGIGCFPPAPSEISVSVSSGPDISLHRPSLSLVDTQPREMVLNRVKLAHSTVRTIGEIRHLYASGDNSRPAIFKECTDGHTSRDCSTEELRLFGVELYELFSGVEWGMGPSRSTGQALHASREEKCLHSANSLTQIHQRKKKERRPEGDSSITYTPLSELGFPTSLCSLVSDLLEEEHSDTSMYRSVVDVEEDLLLMTRFPDRYLFSSNMEGSELTRIYLSPDALYGREEQTSSLLEAYERMIDLSGPVASTGKNEVVFLMGYSGTGKSSIVHSLQGQLVKKGACFVSGKFDAMQQMQPFSAITNALNEYCNLLAHDDSRIEHIREGVLTAVGCDRQVLLEFIPNLSKILPCNADEHASPRQNILSLDAHRRLSFLVRALFRATCSKANPVVLFLDDLQWSDWASLELIHSLITDKQLDTLMFVGCYRENEIGPDHPLVAHLRKIQNTTTTNVTYLRINNLDKNSVNNLMSNALHMLPRQTRSLAEVVQEKTCGNALFVVQFLSSLYDGGDLRFSLVKSRWEWDLESIRARNIADNAVDFMKSKLQCLAPEVAQALKIAAAFGTECSEDIIDIIERDPESIQGVRVSLDVAVSEGLMAKIRGSVFRFSHDQIQDAAYQLISENEKKEFHLQIGRYLRQNSSPEETRSYLFVIVDQLNRGSDLITNHNEKVGLACLSLLAGQNSAAMSAFLPALAFLKVGVAMLSDNDWESHRKLCFDIYNLSAEMKFILGDFEGLKEHLEHVLGRARSLKEKLRAVFILVEYLAAQLLTDDAIDTVSNVLAQLGDPLPSVLCETTVKNEIMKTQDLITGQFDQSVLNLKEMQDVNKKESMKFLNLLACYTYLRRKDLFAVGVSRMVQISFSDGVCKESAYGFAVYGIVLGGSLGDYRGACVLGKIALSLLDRYNAREICARVYCATYGFIFPWVEPIQVTIPPLKEAITIGLSTGDTEFAMMNAHTYHGTSLASGKNLITLMAEMRMYSKQMIELNQTVMYTLNKPLRQTTMNLLGRSADPTKLVGEEMDEDTLLKSAEDGYEGTITSITFFYRMWLEYLFGEYERAAETAEKNKDVAKHNVSRFGLVCNHAFYGGLAALALARKGSGDWSVVIEESMHQMEGWCSLSEWNCQHKLELLRAEHFYLLGDKGRATKAYDLAVKLAAKHRFIHEEALALERFGIFYVEGGDHEAASRCFIRACSCYDQWGACSKTAQIRDLYL